MMNRVRPAKRKLLAASCALALALPPGLAAAPAAQQDRIPTIEVTAEKVGEWQNMRRRVVSADEILRAEVGNGYNTVGKVRDLVLHPDGDRVQYVLYEVPFMYAAYGESDGFVSFSAATIEQGGAAGLRVVFKDPQARQVPDALQLDAKEAGHRLVSRLLGKSLQMAGDRGERRLEDILIDRKSGKITHYVVEAKEDAVFSSDPRALPADLVKVDAQGNAKMLSGTIDDAEDFEPYFLR